MPVILSSYQMNGKISIGNRKKVEVLELKKMKTVKKKNKKNKKKLFLFIKKVGKFVHTNIESKDEITDVKFDKKGEHLICSSNDGTISLFSFSKFEEECSQMRRNFETFEQSEEEKENQSHNENQTENKEKKMTIKKNIKKIKNLNISAISTNNKVNATGWNVNNEEQIACSFASNHRLHIYDLVKGNSNDPMRVFYDKIKTSFLDFKMMKGLRTSSSCIFAGTKSGYVCLFDSKVKGSLPSKRFVHEPK